MPGKSEPFIRTEWGPEDARFVVEMSRANVLHDAWHMLFDGYVPPGDSAQARAAHRATVKRGLRKLMEEELGVSP